MTDRLGEALACTEDLAMCFEHAPIVRAAARAWHTLTSPTDELIERARFPVLDSIGMIASKWLGITHDEAMQRPDIQEAATIIANAVLLASRQGDTDDR